MSISDTGSEAGFLMSVPHRSQKEATMSDSLSAGAVYYGRAALLVIGAIALTAIATML